MGDVVGSRAELEHMLGRARALISNAGDGDWNRESAEWQLAAAELLRDMDGRTAPDPFQLEDGLTPEAAVMRSLGAASTCWTEIRNAGVFDSTRAKRIGEELLRWMRDRGQAARSSWPEADLETTQTIDAADIAAGTMSANVDGARLEVSQQGLKAYDTAGNQVFPEEPPPVTSAVLMTPNGDGRYEVSEVRHYGPGGRLTPEQVAAAQDPDGDLEGYDGPTGRPGGYCFGRDGHGEDVRPGSHLVGGDKDCPRCGQWYTPEQEQRNADVEAGRGLDS